MSEPTMKSFRDNASNRTKGFAKRLRVRTTRTERLLWQELRNKKLGVRFRRQVIIGPYIADFYCPEKRLVVELDGGYHNRPGRPAIDAYRDAAMEAMGIRVLRIEASRMFSDPSAVVAEILMSIH